MVVWKKELEFDDATNMAYIWCSWDAKLLTVQNQGGKVVAWFLNDPNKDQEFKLAVHIVPTGKGPMPGYEEYISTAQFNGGLYVFHFFTKDIKEGKYETGGSV